MADWFDMSKLVGECFKIVRADVDGPILLENMANPSEPPYILLEVDQEGGGGYDSEESWCPCAVLEAHALTREEGREWLH